MSTKDDLQHEADEIRRDACALNAPFPYADCRKLLARFPEQDEGFIPDLDCYLSTIAGYASRGRRLVLLKGADLENARSAIAKSFFERHQEYRVLEAEVTAETTPELFCELMSTEKIRMKMVDLLQALTGPGDA